MNDETRLDIELSEKERRQYFIDKVRETNEVLFNKTGKRPFMYCRTFGCQMNERDSEKIAGVMAEMGYRTAETEKTADIIIYNTCCVRENAENKVFGNLGRLKRFKERRPELKVVLCGCMVQQENIVDIIKSKYRHVDLLFGTFNLHRLPELLHTNQSTNKQVIDIWNEHGEIEEDLPALRRNKWKSGINIMYGCDNFCSYCIVPYVRGRERSRRPEEIVMEAELFSKDGGREILLLGQNVNSYGKTLEKPVTFATLLRSLHEINGIDRIRFMTPHPKDFSDELIETIATREKVCGHIHLPLQSGSTKILTKMNRKYTREQYLRLVEKIRERIPEVSLTTDIIVGFPGETEEDFSETLDIVRRVRFSGAFTFIYSGRTGTPASKMPRLDQGLVSERFDRLLEVQNKIVCEENERYVGKTVKVLTEELSGNKREGRSVVSGRTEGNITVHFEGGEELLGKIVDVRITRNRAFFLEGEKREDLYDDI